MDTMPGPHPAKRNETWFLSSGAYKLAKGKKTRTARQNEQLLMNYMVSECSTGFRKGQGSSDSIPRRHGLEFELDL